MDSNGMVADHTATPKECLRCGKEHNAPEDWCIACRFETLEHAAAMVALTTDGETAADGRSWVEDWALNAMAEAVVGNFERSRLIISTFSRAKWSDNDGSVRGIEDLAGSDAIRQIEYTAAFYEHSRGEHESGHPSCIPCIADEGVDARLGIDVAQAYAMDLRA